MLQSITSPKGQTYVNETYLDEYEMTQILKTEAHTRYTNTESNQYNPTNKTQSF